MACQVLGFSGTASPRQLPGRFPASMAPSRGLVFGLLQLAMGGSTTLGARGLEAAAPGPVFQVLQQASSPVIDARATPGTQDNAFGFEGGQVVKEGGAYWYFAAEMYAYPVDAKMRVALWHAPDPAGPWQRVSTIVQSSQAYGVTRFAQQCNDDYCSWKGARPERLRMRLEYACDPADLRASPWAPMPAFDPAEDRWHVLYVGFVCDGTSFVAVGGGNIWGARSSTPGRTGIAGPYETYGIVIGPNATDPARRWGSADHASPMYVDQISAPYRLRNGSFAAFVGESHYLALAEAPAGPWRIISHESSAVATPSSSFNENPVVSVLRRHDGSSLWVAVFDTVFNEAEGFGFTWSEDGLAWHAGQDVALTGGCRTPLGLVDEGNGTVSLLFTRRWPDCGDQSALPNNGASAITPAMCANVHMATFSVSWGRERRPGRPQASLEDAGASRRERHKRRRLAALSAERAEALRLLGASEASEAEYGGPPRGGTADPQHAAHV